MNSHMKEIYSRREAPRRNVMESNTHIENARPKGSGRRRL
eukprot:UN22468